MNQFNADSIIVVAVALKNKYKRVLAHNDKNNFSFDFMILK